MRSMRNSWCLLGCILLAGCSDQTERIPTATPEMAAAMGVEREQLETGRQLYLAHCEKCHARVEPGKRAPEYWRSTLPHMAKYAKLTYDEEEDLLIYLVAAHGTVHGKDLEH